MIYLTGVRLNGGDTHEHIASVRWKDPETARTGESKRSLIVKWLRGGGEARIAASAGWVEVAVVEADPPHIRARADGDWTNSLLALPRF